MDNYFSVVPGAATAVVVYSAPVVFARYSPVAARIVGGGTSSVVLGGTYSPALPDGAVLVSTGDELTTAAI